MPVKMADLQPRTVIVNIIFQNDNGKIFVFYNDLFVVDAFIRRFLPGYGQEI